MPFFCKKSDTANEVKEDIQRIINFDYIQRYGSLNTETG